MENSKADPHSLSCPGGTSCFKECLHIGREALRDVVSGHSGDVWGWNR